MADATAVIKYVSDITGVQKGVRDIETLNSKMAQTLGQQFTSATQIISSSLESARKVSLRGTEALQKTFPAENIQLGAKFNGILQQVGVTFKDASGQAQKYTETQLKIGDSTQVISGRLQDASVSAKGFGINLSNLISHAVLTIPVWMALREAVMGSISAFKDSIRGIIETDTALQKMKRSLQGTADEIAVQFNAVKLAAEKSATETGVATDKFINSFQKFAQSGFNFETSMAGAQGATKLAITTFSDATAISDSLVGAFRIMADTSGKSGSEIDQLNSHFAQLNALSKLNKISMNEFGDALSKFAPIAKVNNISLQEASALLATLENGGFKATTAGQLLRTSISKLLENLDKLAPSLGVKVNPALDDTTTVLLRVIDAVSKLKATSSNVSPDLQAIFKDVFGGQRTQQGIQALISMRDILLKNLALKGDVKAFNDEFDKTSKTLGNQVERYHALNAEIGKAFLTGFMGEKDFDGAMLKVNETLSKMKDNAEGFAKQIKNIFTNPNSLISPLLTMGLDKIDDKGWKEHMQNMITSALKGRLDPTALSGLINQLSTVSATKVDIGIKDKSIQDYITKFRKMLVTDNKDVTNETSKQVENDKKDVAVSILKKDLLKMETNLKRELQTLGLSEVDIEQRILDFRQKSGDFLTKDIALQSELLTHVKLIEEIELRRSRARGVIDNQLEMLRLQGATALQLIQERSELEKMYGIQLTRQELLGRELEVNREITKEKMNQNNLSTNTVKLFRVAQEFGKEAATKTSEFLTGRINLNDIAHGWMGTQNVDLMKILTKFFPSELEQAQAKDYFFGRTGAGGNIPIPEREAIKNFQPMNLSNIKLPEIKTNVGNVNIEIKKLFKPEETSKAIMDELTNLLEGKLRPLIQDAIEEY